MCGIDMRCLKFQLDMELVMRYDSQNTEKGLRSYGGKIYYVLHLPSNHFHHPCALIKVWRHMAIS